MVNKSDSMILEMSVDVIDKVLGGIQNELTAVACRPAVGRTSFLMIAAKALASKSIPGVFFTLEMDGPYIEKQIYSSSPDSPEFQILPVIIEANLSAITVITARIQELKQKGLIQWAMIDYLGLIRASDETKPRGEPLREILGILSDIRQELEIPILFTLQLARGPNDIKPDIYDSGIGESIIEFCDTIIVLSNYGYPDYSQGWKDIEIDITRRVEALTKTVRLQMNPSELRFCYPAEK